MIDTDTTALIASAEDCFADLTPRKGPSILPAFTAQSEKGLAAALGIRDIVGVNGEAIADSSDLTFESAGTGSVWQVSRPRGRSRP